MKVRSKPVTILMADDDQDDCLSVQESFAELGIVGALHFVDDGCKLLDFLYHRGAYADVESFPRPSVILLDLNMPRKDGREALRNIKSDRHLRSIPVIVLTTSHEEKDIRESYKSGANSFITKPDSFQGLIDVMKSLGKYWFEVVELAPETEGA